MSIRVEASDFHVLNMKTRMPFKYGIASLSVVPHLFVSLSVKVDGRAQRGLASEGLPPKWFTKDPATTFRQDLDDMLDVIRTACDTVIECGEADTVFDLWWETYVRQRDWARSKGYPPLLGAFGVSVVERALIDAFCRARGVPFATAVRSNLLGMRLERMHEELAGSECVGLLPEAPLRSVYARHTVGLADPLTERDVADVGRLDDGLPQSLEASIATYGLRRLKIKVTSEVEPSVDRLVAVARVVESGEWDCSFSLDGNEFFRDVDSLRTFWESIHAVPKLARFMERLLFVEQPLHRDVALTEEVASELLAWKQRPPIIIDESDGEIDSARRALASGYAGTSHKNCKGVFKGIANACLLESRRRRSGARDAYILSGEDLANVGPVALCQDLAVMATLGIDHVERNGHHYFRGLSMYPEGVQRQVIEHHGDLYGRNPEFGFASLGIEDGRVRLGSVVDAPFGVGFELDPRDYVPLDDWTFETLGAVEE